MRNVTDEVSNPFGMRPPCPHSCTGGNRHAVYGYGDANAEFHVIGNHPGVHGGTRTGIPFTGHPAGDRVLDVLEKTGFLTDRDPEPSLSNCFLSYLYLCCVPDGYQPTTADYDAFERFFDAELRAVAADVLLPVGSRTTEHVIVEFTSKGRRIEIDMDELHGTQLRGRGFLVVPIKEPATWKSDDFDRVTAAITILMQTDYHQLVDLGRFIAGGDPYFVR